MKQAKKLLCLVLSLIMLLSLFPASALAEGETEEEFAVQSGGVLVGNSNIVDSENEDGIQNEAAGEKNILDPVILSASEESVRDGLLDVSNDDATPNDKDEIPHSAQDYEAALAEPVHVVFVCEPDETVVTVYDPAQPDENGEPSVIAPEEDGSWLLVPGMYLYDAECEGYVSVERAELTVGPLAKSSNTKEIVVELRATLWKMAKSMAHETSGETYGIDAVSDIDSGTKGLLASGSHMLSDEKSSSLLSESSSVPTIVPYVSCYDFQDLSGWNSGCFTACVTMALKALGKSVTPRDIWTLNGNTTYISSWNAIGTEYNVDMTSQMSLSGSASERQTQLRNILSGLPSGEQFLLLYVVANCPEGSFNHMVVLYLDSNGAFKIHDPGIANGSSLTIETTYMMRSYSSNAEKWEHVTYYRLVRPRGSVTPTTPTVSADNAIYVTPDSARINGTISFPTSLRPTAWGIDVGTSAGNVTNVPFAEGYSNSISSTQTSPYNISFNFSKMAASNPLQAGTKYFYRFWVKYTEDGQTKYAHSEIKNFTTGTSVSISLADSTMTQIGSTNATLGAVVTISGASSTDLKKAGGKIGIQLYTASGSYLGSASDNAPLNLNSNGTINTWYTVGTGKDVNVALTPGTQYKYRFFVNLDSNTNYYSSYKTFTTESGGSTTPTVAKTGTYNSHYYERYDSSITWTEAKAFCQSKGGHLVTITSEAENAWITNTLLSGCGKNVYFIGGTDTSGSWKWVTGETFSYTNWDQDRPEPTNKADEDYAAIMGKQVGANKSPGEWIDIFNDGDTNASYVGYELENCGFICEYEPYTISYNANGGTGAPANQTKTHGTALTLSSTKPTRANASAGSYTVTLNANGGSVSPSSLTANRTTSYSFKNWNTAQNGSGTSYASGASYTANAATTLYAQWNSSSTTAAVTLPTPTRSGYSFQGWATSNTATSGVTGSYTPTGNVTLYATWKANTYTVSYNANGGTGAPASQTKTHGTALTLSSTKPTRANASAGSYTVTLNANEGSVGTSSLTANRTTSYSFKNWNTAQNGSGTSYASGASYTANAAVTLYAQWNSNTTTASVSLPTPTRSGHSFQGWATSSTATSGVTGSYTPSGNVTLYATWKADTYTVSYNANCGTGAPASQAKTHDAALTLSTTTPTRADEFAGSYTVTLSANGGNVSTNSLAAERTTSYSFANWNTAQDGSGTSFAPGASYMADSDVTLYAQWTEMTVTAPVDLPMPTLDGYSFLGWAETSTAASGATGSYTPSADVTLYAIWNENAPPVSPDAPIFRIATVSGRAGGTVTVPVTIENNPGIALFKVNVEYDTSVLQWTGISHKTLDGFWSAEVGKPVVWVGNGDTEYEDDGEIFTLTFTVLENIEPQITSIHLSYDPDDIQTWNESLFNYENVAFAAIDGKVNIVSTVSLTGTALSWNANTDVEVLLYAADIEDSVLNAAAQSGDYSGALKVGTTDEITASGKQYACAFTVSDVEPGTYKLLVMKLGKYIPVIRTVELNEDTTLDAITLWLYGDVTADGKVNGTDALQIKRYFADISSIFMTGTDEVKAERMLAANVTVLLSGDNKVNGTDALQIQRYFADISSVFMYMR